MKKKMKKRKLAPFLISVVLLSLFQLALVIADVIGPVFSYSLGNLIMMAVVLAVILYAGVVYAEEGIGKAALNGAYLSFAASSTLCIVGLASRLYFTKSVLGIGADSRSSLFLMLLSIIIENSIMGGIAAAFAAWLKKRPTK